MYTLLPELQKALPSTVVLKPWCASGISWRGLVKAQISGAHSENFSWDKTWEIAFFTGSQVWLILLVQGPGFGKLWSRPCGWATAWYISS